jgi:hypothetical protein
MIRIHEETELAVRLPSGDCGAEDVCALMQDRGVHVAAMSCYRDRRGCVALIVTEEPVLAARILREAGYSCQSDPALLVGPAPSRPGALVELGLELRRGGVGILSSHICPAEKDMMLAVLHTTDNKAALRILNTAGLC